MKHRPSRESRADKRSGESEPVVVWVPPGEGTITSEGVVVEKIRSSRTEHAAPPAQHSEPRRTPPPEKQPAPPVDIRIEEVEAEEVGYERRAPRAERKEPPERKAPKPEAKEKEPPRREAPKAKAKEQEPARHQPPQREVVIPYRKPSGVAGTAPGLGVAVLNQPLRIPPVWLTDAGPGSQPGLMSELSVPPEVDRIGDAVMKLYDMAVSGKRLITAKPDKGGAIWRIETNRGPRSLKLLHRAAARSLFSIGAQEYLVRQGARVPALVRTRSGDLCVETDGKLWIVTDWIEPLEQATKVDLTGAAALCYGLGEFHRLSQGYVSPAGAQVASRLYRWPKTYQKVLTKIGWFREIARAYSEMPAAQTLLTVTDLFERQAREAITRLERSGYANLVSRGEQTWGIVHQDYGWSNGQMGPGGIWIIDLDGVAFDLPIRDLRKLITSTMDDMGVWDVTWMRGMIDAYNRANPIEPELYQVLLIDMALPNEFYKHVKTGVTKNYTNLRKCGNILPEVGVSVYARIYARVSTEEQAASGFSLGAQRERLEAFCVSQGWGIAGRYIDEGVSAKDLNRPEFQRMMDDAGKGDIILVYKLDRLTRSVRDLDDLLREFDRRGVMFRSVTEQFDTTTATGRLFIRMVAEMAQWERETISERAAFGKQKRAASGEWHGGTVPFGYIAVPSEKTHAGRTLLKLVPDPERHHLIPMIFERYLAGHGIRGLAQWLNLEMGVRTQHGCKFHQLSIRRIITNPIYCGEIEHGRRIGKITTRVQGNHEPLITREVFERTQEMLGIRKTHAPRHATGAYPLSGVAKCGVCGGRVDGHMRDQAKGKRIYKCHQYAVGMGCGKDGERSFTNTNATYIEENLVKEFERLHREPAYLDRLLAEYHSQAEAKSGLTQAELKRMEQDISEAEAAVERWKRLFEKGKIDDEEYLAEVRPHKERAKQLRAALAEAAEKVVELPERQAFGNFAINFRESWEALEPPERKALLQQFVSAFKAQILVFPDRRVEIRPAL